VILCIIIPLISDACLPIVMHVSDNESTRV
jgi:hypothetical protein